MCINTLSYEQSAINFDSFDLMVWLMLYEALVGYDNSNWFSVFDSLKKP